MTAPAIHIAMGLAVLVLMHLERRTANEALTVLDQHNLALCYAFTLWAIARVIGVMP